MAVGLSIVPTNIEIALGTRLLPYALKLMSDSSRVPVTAKWRTSDFRIVDVNPFTGSALALAPGRVALIAEADGFVAVASITVPPPTAVGQSDALIVESFSVIEFQYPSSSDWAYAPQIRARAAPGRTATVITMQFTLPGVGPPTTTWIACGARLTESPRELNGDAESDLGFSFTGQQATEAAATATISFVDDAGMLSTRIIRGSIVRGSLPSRGGDPGACFPG